MRRAVAALLSLSALVACNRPQPQPVRLMSSAESVTMNVTRDPAPEYQLWLTRTEPEDPKHLGLTTTIWWGGEWLSVETEPFGHQPYGVVLRPKPGAFTRPGSYAASVVFQAEGTAPSWAAVYANVAAPAVDASTRHVRFQMAPGGDAPAPRTVCVARVPGTVAVPLPVPAVTFSEETCGESIDAAVSTSGTGYALTLSPVGAALSALPSGATCHVSVAVKFSFDPAPGGGSPWVSAVDLSADLAVQAPATELAEASRNALSFSVYEGYGALSSCQVVTVIDALGGTLTRPALSVSAPWLGATLSATQPYVVTVSARYTSLAAGVYRGTVRHRRPRVPFVGPNRRHVDRGPGGDGRRIRPRAGPPGRSARHSPIWATGGSSCPGASAGAARIPASCGARGPSAGTRARCTP